MACSLASASSFAPRVARAALFPLLCLALLFVWGCDNKPTPEDAESALKKHVSDKLRGVMELAGFRKTDGQESEVNGIATYRVDYEGEFKFVQPCSYNETDGNLVLVDGGGTSNVQPGDIIKVKGQLSFEKSDAGWTLVSARIQPTQLVSLTPVSATQSPSAPAPKSNNIFGIGSGTPPAADLTPLPRESQVPTHHETPGASAVVAPAVKTIPEQVGPTVQTARADLDAATALVEKALARNPEYQAAKADVDAAAARADRARAESGPGSPELVEAAQQSVAAKSKLKKIFDELAAKDPAYVAAQREVAAARSRGK